MAGAFSQDLRERVIDAVLRDGMSRRAAAERFGVSESAAIKWVERVERSGSRTAAQMGGYKPLKLEPHREFVEALRTEKPDISLQPLCDRLGASAAQSRYQCDVRKLLRHARMRTARPPSLSIARRSSHGRLPLR